ncbi:MAG: TIGR00725 family protein [candidate division Zixibacteria bacterium]|nr:TIGR00725 family protein [candidate division Zixibacteria bacterium]
MSKDNKIYIGVIGAGKCGKKLKEQAYAVGAEIAKAGAIVVCGGMKGVMEAACQGAKDSGGLTVGIIPGSDKSAANPYCDVVIPTGMGEARNVIVVQTSDALIALHGKYGTITEMSFALKQKKPLISLVKWDILPEVITINEPVKAVEKAIELVQNDSE